MRQITAKIKISVIPILLVFGGICCAFKVQVSQKPQELLNLAIVESSFSITRVTNDLLDIDETLSDDLLPSPDSPVLDYLPNTDLLIKAISPGYTINEVRNVGAFIELQKLSDTSLSLAGYVLQYINSGGTKSLLLNFSEGSILAGETLLMRLARSSSDGPSDATYSTVIAGSAGRVQLLYNDVVVDEVCWPTTAGANCNTAFNSKKPSSLVRDLASGTFAHNYDNYIPNFQADPPALILPEAPDDSSGGLIPELPPDDEANTEDSISLCYGLEFSEILSYYSEDKTEQFIELFNISDQEIDLAQCKLRYKKKAYNLSGKLAASTYFAFYPAKAEPSFTLTKNPTTENLIELLTMDGQVVDAVSYPHGQKKSVAYARFYDAVGEASWTSTYAITPALPNVYQEFQTCPAGKVINPETGNCVKITATASVTECPEGKYRNPLTGRCKAIASSTSELKPCAEGYERNPETNRCRKITTANEGADYALVPNTREPDKTVFIATGIVVLLVTLGSGYIVLQFRREIARSVRKARQRLNHIRKNLVARGIRFYRNKKP